MSDVNRVVMNQLASEFGTSHLGGKQPIYDGQKGLFTACALPFNSKDFVIKLVDKEVKGSTSARERVFKVSIKLASRIDPHNLEQFLTGKRWDTSKETIQVLDIVSRESPSNKTDVGDGLECWRGYYQSIRPTQMGMSINIGRGGGNGEHGGAGGRGRGGGSESTVFGFPCDSEVGSSSGGGEVLSSEHEKKMSLQLVLVSGANPPVSLKGFKFPTRPGAGTVEQKFVVKANHFLVKLKQKVLHHCDVSINPKVISRGINRDVMKQLVSEYGTSHLGGKQPIYDGRKCLYTAGALPFNLKDFVIKLVDEEVKGSTSARFVSKNIFSSSFMYLMGLYTLILSPWVPLFFCVDDTSSCSVASIACPTLYAYLKLVSVVVESVFGAILFLGLKAYVVLLIPNNEAIIIGLDGVRPHILPVTIP
ncbi:hypothetical protein IFM89_034698 [Coptis chinensis]|uniref:Argonaute linker 1 domain-containing protein n=1 Tax=Coptis chinensis TaxID=261450 RepID=A0A835LHA3_9MAGN|nr:hypothetical protein IFM89_034698 [Coptis chinensis]